MIPQKKERTKLKLVKPPGEPSAPMKVGKRHHGLLIHLRHQPGLTDQELIGVTGRGDNDVQTRRAELVSMGLVTAADEKRKTPRGRWAQVWKLTAAGRRLARTLSVENERNKP